MGKCGIFKTKALLIFFTKGKILLLDWGKERESELMCVRVCTETEGKDSGS